MYMYTLTSMYSTYVSVSNLSTLCTVQQSMCICKCASICTVPINQTQSPAAGPQDLFSSNIFSSLSVENYAIRKHPGRLTAGSHTI